MLRAMVFRGRVGSQTGGLPADDAEFITGAYLYLLRREPDAGGLAHYLDRLKSGRERDTVLRDLVESPEFADLTNKAGVVWPLEAPIGYAGQLATEVQDERREAALGLTLADCEFYHSTDLPSGEVIEGPWDLRGREAEYLGGIELDGRTVLELGPATGHLTFWMEQRGAAVTGFEVGYDRTVDVIPASGPDVESFRRSIMDTVRRVNNTWWYSHLAHESDAKMVYGDIYELPTDIGSYDVGVFGAILLHLERPLRALASAAAVASEALVVCEPVGSIDGADPDARMRPLPTGTENLTGWWHLSPAAVVEMLSAVGFGNTETTVHKQLYHPGHNMAQDAVEVEMFTVVGRPT